MKPGKLSKSCLSFLLMLMLLLSALVQAINAQDNETETAAQAINARTIEIVFLHESSQIEFSSAVDAIMEQLKFTDIEINYRKVQHDSGTMPDEVCEMGASGLSMLIDATPSGSIAIRNTLEVHRIPYFNFDYTIQSLVKLMEFYLAQRQAVDAVFVFNDEIASSEAFHHFVRASSLRVMIHDSSTFERLKTFRPVPDFTVLIAATDSVERLFQNADDAGLVRRSPDSWSVMFTDFTGETFKHAEYPEMSRLLPHKNVCCNPNCICSSHVTLKFEALSSFLHQMVPVFEANGFPIRRFECSDERDVTTTTTTPDSAEQLLNDLSRMIETNDLIYVDDELKIWQNLRFDVRRSLNGSSSIETISTVDRNGLKAVGVPVIGKTRRFFRIGVTESLPYTYYKRDPLTDKILIDEYRKPIYEGYCMDLITQLSRKLNFDYELVEPTSGKFGERQSNGKFDGLVGDMVRGELDVIVGALKMTAEREEVIDFVVPYFDQSGILIVMKKPIPDTSLFKFMSVLRLEVWLSILGALSITAIVIWILEVFSPYSARNWNYAEPCRNFTLRESFWFSLTSFTPQGGGEAPKALSGRVIVAAYWLFVVLMLATFTANLAAFLTVERMQSPVQSLDQLARQSRINYTVVKGSDTHQYFQNMRNAEDKLYELWKNLTLSTTSDDVQYRIWDYPVKEQYASILMSIEATRTLPNASEGFRIVNERETNDFAFIHDAQEIKYEISRNCNYSAVGEVFAEQSYAIAVQQGSELQDEFSRAILELQKERFFEELTSRYWNSSFTASCINSDDSEGITLESLGGVFIATLVGLVVAMVVLVGEVYYYKRKSKKENERKQLAVFTTTRIQPLDKFDYADKVIKGGLLLGSGNFIPVNKKPRLSFVSVQPRD